MKVLTLFTLCFFVVYGTKLNKPRVLLPIFQNVRMNFTLEGIGCYKWSTPSLDLIEIKSIETEASPECSSRAVVTTAVVEPVRHTAVVLAEDALTGQIVRADIIIDVISHLSIVTTTRELFVEEPPEIFEVVAFDNQGNQFTTLEGIELEWTLKGIHKESVVVRFINFRESPYETPDSVVKLDSVGKQGHKVLIEGVKTGSVTVSVALPYTEYQDVHPDAVQLLVVANILIEPSEATILPGDIINYKVSQVKSGRLIDIPLSGSQFTLESQDENIAKVSVSQVTGVRLGQVTLVLKDINLNELELKNPPKATLTVALPHKIGLKLLPYDHWEIMSKQFATFVSEIFDENNKKFYLGSEARIRTEVPEELFSVYSRVTNGSLVYGRGGNPGSGPVTSRLLSTRRDLPQLSSTRTLYVLPEIGVKPPRVVLPWYSGAEADQVPLRPSGGDGSYQWKSSNKSIVSVNSRGLLQPNALGTALVTVAIKNREYNNASSTIFVVRPAHLRIVDHVNEALVGEPILLNVAVYGHIEQDGKVETVPFDRCGSIQLNLTAEGEFERTEPSTTEPVDDACTVLAVLGRAAGRAKVTVSHRLPDGELLEASATVSAFDPLQVLHPERGTAVLAVGCSRHLVFRGGPKFGKFVAQVQVDKDLILHTHVLEEPAFYVVSILCLKVGEANLVLTIKTGPRGAGKQAHSSVLVVCGQPWTLSLHPDLGPDCPLTETAVAAANSRLRVKVIVQDQFGNVFDNATSLRFQVEVDRKTVAEVEDTAEVGLEVLDTTGRYLVPGDHFVVVNTLLATGPFILRARITGYQDWLLRSLNVPVPHVPHIEEATLACAILKAANLEVSAVTLLHPTKELSLGVLEGSGHFSLAVGPSDLAQARYVPGKREIRLLPQLDGMGTLSLRDLCLPYPPVVVPLRVLQVGRIKIELTDKLEKGKKGTGLIKFYDGDGRLLPLAGKEEEDLTIAIADSGIAEVVFLEPTPGDRARGSLRFTAAGVGLGATMVRATWMELASDVTSLLVFSPLRIYPRNLTVALGAETQLEVHGGPPEATLQWSVADSLLASVTPSGLVRASRLGHTSLQAAALGPDGQAYCRDSVELHVISLSKIRILAPLTNLLVGAEFPVVASGIPSSITPLILGSIHPSLQFRWTLSFPGILQLRDRLPGVLLSNEDRLSMHIKALKPGKCTLFLTVLLRSHDRIVSTLNASMEFEVIENLHWRVPQVEENSILIAPLTKMNLLLNRDLEGLKYHVLNYPDDTDEGSGRDLRKNNAVVRVSETGLLSSETTLGTAVIIAEGRAEQVWRAPLVVQVRPVHYLMVSVASELEGALRYLPQGLRLPLEASYHDGLGSLFTAAPCHLQASASRLDRVQLSQGPANTSFTVSLDNSGSAVLQFTDLQLQSSDYIKLPIEVAITPLRSHLSLGEVVCFSAPFQGSWTADNDVVAVDENGTAIALKLGASVVSYSRGAPHSMLSTFLTLEVLPVVAVQLGPPSQPLLTNAAPEARLAVPVYLLNERHKRDGLPPSSSCPEPFLPSSFPFHCEIRFNSFSVPEGIQHVFSVEPEFDAKAGHYCCTIRSRSGPSHNTSLINSNVTLRAVTESLCSDSVVLPFLAAVVVTPAALDLPTLHSRALLTLRAAPQVLQQVILEPSDGTVLTLTPLSSPSPSTLLFRLSVSRSVDQSIFYRDLAVYVLSPATGQRMKVPVSSFLGRPSSSTCLEFKTDEWWLPLAELLGSYKLHLLGLASLMACYLGFMYLKAALAGGATVIAASPLASSQGSFISSQVDSYGNIHSFRSSPGELAERKRRSNLFT